jgi:hypothetical protein
MPNRARRGIGSSDTVLAKRSEKAGKKARLGVLILILLFASAVFAERVSAAPEKHSTATAPFQTRSAPSSLSGMGQPSSQNGLVGGCSGCNADNYSEAPNGDYVVQATGQFPSVSGVTSESDSMVGTNNPNEFSLQINTNHFPYQNEGPISQLGPRSGTGWVQFTFQNDPAGSICEGLAGVFCTATGVLIEYWVFGISEAQCVPESLVSNGEQIGWSWWPGPGEPGCSWFGPETSAPSDLTAEDLPVLNLTGSVAGGVDQAKLCISAEGASSPWNLPSSETNKCYASPPVSDQVLNLGQSPNWTSAEFNVFGLTNGSQANFNSGSTIVVQDVLDEKAQTGQPLLPSMCEWGGGTGESNNLNIIPASDGDWVPNLLHRCFAGLFTVPDQDLPAVFNGDNSFVEFTESNGPAPEVAEVVSEVNPAGSGSVWPDCSGGCLYAVSSAVSISEYSDYASNGYEFYSWDESGLPTGQSSTPCTTSQELCNFIMPDNAVMLWADFFLAPEPFEFAISPPVQQPGTLTFSFDVTTTSATNSVLPIAGPATVSLSLAFTTGTQGLSWSFAQNPITLNTTPGATISDQVTFEPDSCLSYEGAEVSGLYISGFSLTSDATGQSSDFSLTIPSDRPIFNQTANNELLNPCYQRPPVGTTLNDGFYGQSVAPSESGSAISLTIDPLSLVSCQPSCDLPQPGLSNVITAALVTDSSTVNTEQGSFVLYYQCASVCQSSHNNGIEPTMEYWTGSEWRTAAQINISNGTISGVIPGPSSGTFVAIGYPSESSTSLLTLILVGVSVAAVVVAIGAIWLARKSTRIPRGSPSLEGGSKGQR